MAMSFFIIRFLYEHIRSGFLLPADPGLQGINGDGSIFSLLAGKVENRTVPIFPNAITRIRLVWTQAENDVKASP
jgi:hypothetical protein